MSETGNSEDGCGPGCGLSVIIIVLAVLLTGMLGPILLAAGWVLVGLLSLMLVLYLLARFFGLIRKFLGWFFSPFIMVFKSAQALLKKKTESSEISESWSMPDPGSPEYLAWANREGRYADDPNYYPEAEGLSSDWSKINPIWQYTWRIALIVLTPLAVVGFFEVLFSM